MWKILPTRRQWISWSLPSKLTAIGLLVGILSVVISITIIVIGHIIEGKKETLYFNILAPNISSKHAYENVILTFGHELNDYKLVDVIGSYYICLKKPDVFFHYFPEWIFVFRDKTKSKLREFRVTDSRIPYLPRFHNFDFEDLLNHTRFPELQGGEIISYINFKVSPQYLGLKVHYNDSDEKQSAQGSYVIAVLDEDGRSLFDLNGASSNDRIDEVEESVNERVLGRFRVAGRPTDYIKHAMVLEDPLRLGKIEIRQAQINASEFYQSLDPILDWNIDIEEAISYVRLKEAKAIPPDKFGMGGGPGVFRLTNKNHLNLRGSFWKIPYRIGVRPVLVDANNGKVYAINNKGIFSTHWEGTFELEE